MIVNWEYEVLTPYGQFYIQHSTLKEMTLEEIKKEKESGTDGDKLVVMLTDYIKDNPTDDEALYMRGVSNFSLGHRSDAINDYLAALRLNPRSKAGMALKTTYEILNYYNKDLYNP